jgi:L-fucose mutarotase/ribose pyranase (RbsD/FucU family)
MTIGSPPLIAPDLPRRPAATGQGDAIAPVEASDPAGRAETRARIRDRLDAACARAAPDAAVLPPAGADVHPPARAAPAVVARDERAPQARAILRKGAIAP